MMHFLDGFLPRVLPQGYLLEHNVFIRPHEGKSDLVKSLRSKSSQLHQCAPPVRLLVIHDQDSNDCIELKRSLVDIVETYRVDAYPICVRIACRELENGYLGNLAAVETLYPTSKAGSLSRKAKYRDSDRLIGSQEMEIITKRTFAKTDCARRIGPILSIDDNRSASFNQFVSGLTKLLA